MSCRSNEKRVLARCYPKNGNCFPDREFYGGLCYKKCPVGSRRSAGSTCVQSIRWRGNTHLWIVKRALDLLKNSNDPIGQRIHSIMNKKSCRNKWEEGLWNEDDDNNKDKPLKSHGSHFFNALGRDYKMASALPLKRTHLVESRVGTQNAFKHMIDRISVVSKTSNPSEGDCEMLDAALHYVTDVTMPIHANGFSGGQIPLMLHPVSEYYAPHIQSRFPARANWDRRWHTQSLSSVCGSISRKSNADHTSSLMCALRNSGSICWTTPEFGINYKCYCFLNDPSVDEAIGRVLYNAYQSTASCIYAATKATFYH
ncbi:hypothetical protein BWQ96_09667 [Gracilariopsis chorda]|uniref:Uncharacterized protein n=1 Tax=Gracilariopsis chorda TaxID=448386 RepID=A0A2V3IEV4_9FLOR|nr:hypothetical protein BWQ96_09667 [Gracilariopsis chorda]|eukprot:PXF40616.1 hypothetical protein BWQ96_09667 [Gracilariopsis chorda]